LNDELLPSLALSTHSVSDAPKSLFRLPDAPSSPQQANLSHPSDIKKDPPPSSTDEGKGPDNSSHVLPMLDETISQCQLETADEETDLPLPVSSPLPPSSSPPEPLENYSQPSGPGSILHKNSLSEPSREQEANQIPQPIAPEKDHLNVPLTPTSALSQENRDIQSHDSHNEASSSPLSQDTPEFHADDSPLDNIPLNEDLMNNLIPISHPTEATDTLERISESFNQELPDLSFQGDAPLRPMQRSPSPIRSSSPFRPSELAPIASSPPSSPTITDSYLDVYNERNLTPTTEVFKFSFFLRLKGSDIHPLGFHQS
jgi:hypothetical protein